MNSPHGRADETRTPTNDSDSFIGKEQLLGQFARQLQQFEQWNDQRDWLAFHNHHYDWWMFPIDEISSRGREYQLPHDVLVELRHDDQFIDDLRRGVRMMVRSWGWDIDRSQAVDKPDDKQKWSFWPVRLYKAGKCMWLFGQDDYYRSLKAYARVIKDDKKEKLDFFSHTKGSKADVLEEWSRLERTRT